MTPEEFAGKQDESLRISIASQIYSRIVSRELDKEAGCEESNEDMFTRMAKRSISMTDILLYELSK